METIFQQSDFDDFYRWLNLDDESITWQGRYQKEFDDFWEIVFLHGLSLQQLSERLNYLVKNSSEGPLKTWLNWIYDHLVIYTFEKKELSIFDISQQMNIEYTNVAKTLRDHYVANYPFLVSQINEALSVSNLASEKLSTAHIDVERIVQNVEPHHSERDDNLYRSLEVTLYPDFQKLLDKIRKNFISSDINFYELENQTKLSNQFRFLKEVAVLAIIAVVGITVLRYGNVFYESYLAEKIKIFEPQFLWLDKTISFKDETQQVIAKKEILNEISELERIISQKEEGREQKEERFDVESDVTLTSIDDLPNRLDRADVEKSEYEESRTGVGFNFRSYRYGRNRVFRIMLNAVRPDQVKEKMDRLLELYGAGPADSVKPGTEVPGGLYYNLYVPREYLREFIVQTMEGEEANLFETKTRGRSPPGKNKVFIFVKSI